jgi:SAM-dependent methyltransferase
MSYQDYVIKDGKFIGKFEEMYQKFPDPWHQSEVARNAHSYSRNITTLNILRYNIKSVVEFGCGYGHNANLIYEATGAKIKGVDISPTAINKARQLFPHLDFAVDTVDNIEAYREYDGVLFAEITWYILNSLDSILDKLLLHFHGKYFLHNLVFYHGGQEYGREYFTNLKEFINYVPFKLLASSECFEAGNNTYETASIFKIEKKT